MDLNEARQVYDGHLIDINDPQVIVLLLTLI
jgi:hypothetical protein